mmetsp:Transcript_5516/g.12588  ORF Transcript_5516/g.12588 Transcript_5516/m.12588 type:complete len:85 (+) Transcript_5516:612-866(+)
MVCAAGAVRIGQKQQQQSFLDLPSVLKRTVQSKVQILDNEFFRRFRRGVANGMPQISQSLPNAHGESPRYLVSGLLMTPKDNGP